MKLSDFLAVAGQQDDQESKPTILPEAAIERMREHAVRYARQLEGPRFKIGDLVTPLPELRNHERWHAALGDRHPSGRTSPTFYSRTVGLSALRSMPRYARAQRQRLRRRDGPLGRKLHIRGMEAQAVTRAADRRKRLLQAVESGKLRGFQAVNLATVREILAHEAKAPMRGGAAEMKHTSLFGDSHKQLDLF